MSQLTFTFADDQPADRNATVAWLTDHCQRRVIDEKWLLVEHLRVGQQWKDRLTQSGCWHVNLHAKTMRLIVNELAAGWLASNRWMSIGRSGLELLFDSVVQELSQTQRLVYLQPTKSSRHSLCRLLVRTYNDWRAAGLSVEDISPAAMEIPAKAADLSLIFTAVRQRLAATQQVDYIDCIDGIIHALQTQSLSLPPGLVLLQPETFLLSRRERDLLNLLRDRGAQWCEPTSIASIPIDEQPEIKLTRQIAVVDANEVRGVLQQCFAAPEGPRRLDQVEVLVSDYERYAPLVLESVCQSEKLEDLPVTFAEGIACIYSRPGRLLRSWIRWSQSDYLQSKAVEIVREGLLARPEAAAAIGYARLASTLRRVPVGFGLERYLPQIRSELTSAERDARHKAADDPDFQGDCGASNLRGLLSTLEPLVRLAPKPDATAVELLESARQLIDRHARAESLVDRYARAKLLDDIDGLIALVRTHSDALTNVRAWLEELPARSRLFASTPRPGALHVAPLEQGGASGRAHLFILGLDDRKFPRRQMVDPILLDAERQRMSRDLITSDQWSAHQQAAVQRVLERSRGIPNLSIVFSHSLLEVTDDSENFASPIVSSLVEDQSPPSIVAFVTEHGSQALSNAENFLRQLLTEPHAQLRREQVETAYPRIVQQRRAATAQTSEPYSAFDGWVPQAGRDLLAGATTKPMSPSRLEMLGACPRKYFFARALGITTPDQWDIDPDRWLTALDVGTLLHELFEEFLRELGANNQHPDPAKHHGRLIELLQVKIETAVQRVPVHNREAFERQCGELRETCEIFLEKEHDYWLQRQAATWIMEASLGSLAHSQDHTSTEIDTDSPIVIELASGQQLHLCGRIDRIDRTVQANNPDCFIWDYKTGSAWGYDLGDPFQQGRKLQPYLYTRMLAARFAQLGHNPQAVRSFGYFFPSPRAEGLRLEWSVNDLSQGDDVLEHMLDLLAAGTFIATNNENDCSFCDYQTVCGPPKTLVQISNLKAATSDNEQLNAWRELRS